MVQNYTGKSSNKFYLGFPYISKPPIILVITNLYCIALSNLTERHPWIQHHTWRNQSCHRLDPCSKSDSIFPTDTQETFCFMNPQNTLLIIYIFLFNCRLKKIINWLSYTSHFNNCFLGVACLTKSYLYCIFHYLFPKLHKVCQGPPKELFGYQLPVGCKMKEGSTVYSRSPIPVANFQPNTRYPSLPKFTRINQQVKKTIKFFISTNLRFLNHLLLGGTQLPNGDQFNVLSILRCRNCFPIFQLHFVHIHLQIHKKNSSKYNYPDISVPFLRYMVAYFLW